MIIRLIVSRRRGRSYDTSTAVALSVWIFSVLRVVLNETEIDYPRQGSNLRPRAPEARALIH